MRLTTRDVLLLMMPALVVLVVLTFGTMLTLGYGSFVPADETMIRPQVLVAYLDDLVDRPLESLEYAVEIPHPGHPDLVPTVGTSPFS